VSERIILQERYKFIFSRQGLSILAFPDSELILNMQSIKTFGRTSSKGDEPIATPLPTQENTTQGNISMPLIGPSLFNNAFRSSVHIASKGWMVNKELEMV
jgi:hypothetical protein